MTEFEKLVWSVVVLVLSGLERMHHPHRGRVGDGEGHFFFVLLLLLPMSVVTALIVFRDATAMSKKRVPLTVGLGARMGISVLALVVSTLSVGPVVAIVAWMVGHMLLG